MRATIAPLILCHTLNIAPGMAANGKAAKCIVANDEARPLFCIPTSMDIAARFRIGRCKSDATA